MIGFPAPGAASALAERMALPVFLPLPAPKDATPWAFLSWGSIPLHGLSQSLRQRPLDRRHLSWGSVPLQRVQEERVHVRPVARFGSPVVPGSADRSHPVDYGVARRFSQPLSDLLPLPAAPPFSGGFRSWGLPFRGSFLPRSPDDSSPPACPRDVLPVGCAAPVPRRGLPRAHRPAS